MKHAQGTYVPGLAAKSVRLAYNREIHPVTSWRTNG